MPLDGAVRERRQPVFVLLEHLERVVDDFAPGDDGFR